VRDVAPDLDAFDRDGVCILHDVVAPDLLATFEAQVAEVGRAECAKLGIDPGSREPLAAALDHDRDYRVFLFGKIKQLSSLGAMTRCVLDQLDAAGVLARLGIAVPGVHQTLKGDLPDDHAYDLPFHQDHVLNRSNRSCRVWIALRDVDATCGSMEVAPRSHRHKFDYVAGEDGYLHVEEADVAGRFETRTLELPAGSGVLFSPWLVHRTVPNRGQRIRFSLIVHVDDLTALYDASELARCAHPPKT
jgi:hypothetical protein